MTASPSKVDYSKKWYVLSAVGMGVFLATIDGSIVNVSLPTMENRSRPILRWWNGWCLPTC